MNRDGLENDAFIPHLSWWVFEAHIPSGNQEVLQFFRQPSVWNFPVVFHHVLPRLARRYAVEGKRADLLLCAEFFELAPSQKEAMQLMKGVEEAFRGRPITRLPDELLSALTKSGQAPLPFRLKQGDPVAVAEALTVLSNPKAYTDEQLQLVRIFGDIRHPEAVPALLAMVSSARTSSLARAALASLSAYDEESIGSKIIDELPGLTGNVQTAAFNTLASRGHWSLQLLKAIQTGGLKRTQIPDEISNRLRASKDQQVQELATKLLPQVQPVPVEFQDRINQITAVLQRAPGNPYAGESAYDLRCAACHKLFFKGGNIGPDLTAYQRDNLGTMLPSIVNPNAEIREGYQYYNVETKDGRSLSGFFVDRDNQVTILRELDGESFTLRAAEIQDLQPVGRSLMPEGLLEGMTDQELRDLFAYLRISQPITN
jgi:putative heme-binding domain-containing protein